MDDTRNAGNVIRKLFDITPCRLDETRNPLNVVRNRVNKVRNRWNKARSGRSQR